MAKLHSTYDAETKIYFVTTNTHYRKKLFIDDRMARIVVDTLFFIQKKKWIDLIAYVVMPDGIHTMFESVGKKNVSEVMHSLKSMVVHKIFQQLSQPNKRGFHASLGMLLTRQSMESLAMGRKIYPRIWQRSFYDRVVDNEKYFNHLINYIHYNPVKDGLVNRPEEWTWSSIHIYKEKGYY